MAIGAVTARTGSLASRSLCWALLAPMGLLVSACTATPPEVASQTSPPDGPVVVAVIDSGTADAQASLLDGYTVRQSDGALPSDHTSQVLSVLLGSGQADQLAPSAVELLVLPVDLSDSHPGDVLATRLGEAASARADVVLVAVGTRVDRVGICDGVSALAGIGAAVVAAAGNFPGLGADYPARCEGAISVAALDAPGVFAAYSTRSQADFGMVVKGVEAVGLSGEVTEPGGTSMAAARAAHEITRRVIDKGVLTASDLEALLEPLPTTGNR